MPSGDAARKYPRIAGEWQRIGSGFRIDRARNALILLGATVSLARLIHPPGGPPNQAPERMSASLRIFHVVGARPNFMKVAPILRALGADSRFSSILVHTGQHYDEAMSGSFFRDLEIPEPDVNLGVGSGSHAEQTAQILVGIEKLLLQEKPDLVLVPGDVNSTLAAALAAAKLKIPVGHVEAGLRSRDEGMPEEINRILTDRIASILLTPSRDGDENLLAEGTDPARIHFVGNVMIDTLFHLIPKARALGAPAKHGVEPGGYGLVTLHRPSNVDDPAMLKGIISALSQIGSQVPLLFPVHPRTRQRIMDLGITLSKIRLLDPIPYLEMAGLVDSAAIVLTDSGGLQEETTALGVPCLTLRSSTERPVTITHGTNTLVADRSAASILQAWETARTGAATKADRPQIEGWDGHAAERIRDVLATWADSR